MNKAHAPESIISTLTSYRWMISRTSIKNKQSRAAASELNKCFDGRLLCVMRVTCVTFLSVRPKHVVRGRAVLSIFTPTSN